MSDITPVQHRIVLVPRIRYLDDQGRVQTPEPMLAIRCRDCKESYTFSGATTPETVLDWQTLHILGAQLNI